MKILVCVKQVADSESPFSLKEDGSSLVFGDRVSRRINSYDEYAIEEALLTAENHSGTEIHALSLGPDVVKESLRRALSMGVHEAYHLPSDNEGIIDPGLKARRISRFARERGYDLILMGLMSEDFGNAMVGPMTAELLGLPAATHVMSLNINLEGGTLHAEREIDGTLRHGVTLRLPALVTVQSGINRPRYPSLSNVLRAKAAVIPTLSPDADPEEDHIALSRSLSLPREIRRGTLLQGSSADMAEELWKYLHARSLL